jgi:hypothetical protein
LEYPEETLTPEERRTNILDIVETAGLAAEINEIPKKVSMDMGNDGSDGSEAEAEPMDVEEDEVYAKRYGDDMETSEPDKKESEKMANADWEQLGESAKSKKNRANFVRDTVTAFYAGDSSYYAVLSPNGESVTMILIRKNMPMYVVDNNVGAGGDANGGAMYERRRELLRG